MIRWRPNHPLQLTGAAVLRQMRSMLRLPPVLYDELNTVLVEQSSVKTAVPEWLQRFAGEHLALLPPN